MKNGDVNCAIPENRTDEMNRIIEEWGKDNPMDYFKALNILNMSSNGTVKAAVFKEIYKITRLYIPSTLFKFYSVSSEEEKNLTKFKTLSNGEIFLANVNDFNDPFDSQGFYYDPKQLANIEPLKPYGGKLIDSFASFIRVTSLTENDAQAMPMWAHYGSNHTGYCVSYDMLSNAALRSCIFPVQYTHDRLDITHIMQEQAQKIVDETHRQSKLGNTITLDDLTLVYITSLLCNIKHSSWSYEKEFRCVAGTTSEKKQYIEAKPKGIFIGINCAPLHEKQLLGIARSWGVPAYRMGVDKYSDTYTLIANRCM